MTTTETEHPQAGAAGETLAQRASRLFISVPPEAVLLAVLLAMGGWFWNSSEVFMTTINMRNVLLSVSVLGILAAPSTLLLISGNFDLSIASNAAMCGVAVAMVADGHSTALAIFVAVIAGLLAGALNGLLVSGLGIASIIVTLGTFQAYRGIARLMANGQTIRLRGEIDFITDRIVGIPTQVVLFIIITAITMFVVRYTRFGRAVYAIGSNLVAARLAGIRQRPTVFVLFLVSGVMAALAGLILASQLDAASPNAATGDELKVVAAVILGGASLSGGRGTIIGTLLGVLILGVLQNGLTLLSVTSFWRDVATGTVLIAAVGLDRVRVMLGGQ
ncbi:MAG: ABC transporter permease [bacterium]|nr:ABC transporter permease [bacterium]MDE0217183.1 ABC transporter permease [bacterium]